MYERRFSRPDYVEDIEDDWRDLDRKRYSNDDHSRMAGPDYRRPMDQRLTKGESNQPGYPGVSGKTIHGGSWFNQSRYQEQRKFVGKGPKGYHRSDDRIYEEVCEKLLHDPDVDASNIGVKVENGFVTLEGVVDSRRSKKLAEYLIDDLPGVNDVQNELSIDSDSFRGGPDEATKKDLGIGSQEGR